MTPVSTVRIEPAGESHLAEIRTLASTIWHTCYPGIISAEQIEHMLAWMYAPDTLREELLVQGIRYDRLLLDDALTGFAAYGPTAEPAVWKLHKLYLLPAQHGRGLGSQLLRHCEIQVRSQGAEQLLLNVNKRNARAIAAYERNGYVIKESVCNDIGRGFVMDDYVMIKPLR